MAPGPAHAIVRLKSHQAIRDRGKGMRIRLDSRVRRAATLSAAVTVALLALAAAPLPARADISDPSAWPSWSDTIPGFAASYDTATGVKIGSGGAVYVCGLRGNAAGDKEATLAKYVDGVLAWGPKAYNGAGGLDEIAAAMAPGPKGAVYTVGRSGGYADGNVLLVKWSAKTGAVVWVRRYDGRAHKGDWGYEIGVDRRGNVTIAGVSQGRDTYEDWLLRSWTPSGKTRWTWRSDWSAHAVDSVNDLLVAGDGSVYATGFVNAGGPSRATTIRLSATGRHLWSRLYAGPDGLSASAYAISARPGGGVYVCGYTVTTSVAQDGIVMSHTPSGKRTVFALDSGSGGATHQGFQDIAVTATKHVVAVGWDQVAGMLHPHYAVYNPAGTIANKTTIGSADSDEFTAVATDAFGGYYMAGTRSMAAGDRRLLTMRRSTLAGGGWWTFLSGPSASDDVDASAIAVRGSTAVVVGHADSGVPSGVDQIVVGFPY